MEALVPGLGLSAGQQVVALFSWLFVGAKSPVTVYDDKVTDGKSCGSLNGWREGCIIFLK